MFLRQLGKFEYELDDVKVFIFMLLDVITVLLFKEIYSHFLDIY